MGSGGFFIEVRQARIRAPSNCEGRDMGNVPVAHTAQNLALSLLRRIAIRVSSSGGTPGTERAYAQRNLVIVATR